MISKIIDFIGIPNIMFITAMAILTSVALSATYRLAQAKEELQSLRANHATLLAEATASVRDEERRIHTDQEEASRAYIAQVEKDRIAAVDAAASAVAAEQRMRHTIAAAGRAATCRDSTSSGNSQAVAALQAVLSACIGGHRSLGADAASELAECRSRGIQCAQRYDAVTKVPQ